MGTPTAPTWPSCLAAAAAAKSLQSSLGTLSDPTSACGPALRLRTAPASQCGGRAPGSLGTLGRVLRGAPGRVTRWRRGRCGRGWKGPALRAPRCPRVPPCRGCTVPAHPGPGRPPPLQASQSPANFFRRCEGDFLNSGAYLIVAAEGGQRGHGNLGRELVSAGPRSGRHGTGAAGGGPGSTWQACPGRAPATRLTTRSTCTAALGPSEGLPSAPPASARPGQARLPAVTSHRPRDVTQRPSRGEAACGPRPEPLPARRPSRCPASLLCRTGSRKAEAPRPWGEAGLVKLRALEDPACLWTARSSVQFGSATQSCLALWDPVNHSTPGLPVHHQLPEFTPTHAH